MDRNENKEIVVKIETNGESELYFKAEQFDDNKPSCSNYDRSQIPQCKFETSMDPLAAVKMETDDKYSDGNKLNPPTNDIEIQIENVVQSELLTIHHTTLLKPTENKAKLRYQNNQYDNNIGKLNYEILENERMEVSCSKCKLHINKDDSFKLSGLEGVMIILCSKCTQEDSRNHPANKIKHECSECNKTFANKYVLSDHKNVVHRKLIMYACNECNKTFTYKSNLNAHIIAVHLKIKKKYCSHCNKTFIQKSHLTDHYNAVHLKMKKYRCSECNKRFARKSHLYVHLNAVHRKLKMFACNECDKTFAAKFVLNKHIFAVHSKIKMFTCSECNKAFTQKSHLIGHIKNVHLKVRNIT